VNKVELADLFSQEIHSKEDYKFCEKTAFIIGDYASRTEKDLKESFLVVALLHRYHKVDESLIEEFANDLSDFELEALLILSNPFELEEQAVYELNNNRLSLIVKLASKIEELKQIKETNFSKKLDYLNQISLLNFLIGDGCVELSAKLEAQINISKKILWESL
jgi:hypothetical protein